VKGWSEIGPLEMVVLSAVTIEGSAYCVPIQRRVQELLGHNVSESAVALTLARLQRKGYVRSAFSDPTRKRGGRAKRMFAILPPGQAALRRSLFIAGTACNAIMASGK